MNRLLKKVIQWSVGGGTFLATLLMTGCASAPPAAPQPQPPARPAESASLVNVFGEFSGRPGGSSREGDGSYQQHTFGEEGYDADVAIDPQGKWLAFSSTRHSEHAHLYLQRTDGLSTIELTRGEWDDAQPCFSPDGKRIAFCSTRNGTWDIFVMDVDGRNVVQVTSDAGQEMHPSFSPDGGRLVYCGLGGRSDQWELWTVNLSLQERRMIGYGLFPAWSPQKNVERIAFQRARQRGSRWFSLWTVDLVDGEPRRQTEVAVSSNAALLTPGWSPDGQKLSFAAVVEPQVGTRSRGQQDIWMINADGTGRRRLTENQGLNLSPCWAVDNRVYFTSDRGGRENVWSVQAEGRPALAGPGNGESRPNEPGEKLGATDGREIAP